MKAKFLRVVRSLVLSYLAITLVLTACQRSFIYHPRTAPAETLVRQAKGVGLVPWKNSRDEIIGWRREYTSTPKPKNRLLVFHGNTGYALHREHFVTGFGELDAGATWDVHIFEYPGYGARPGAPSEKSIVPAAREAFQQLLAEDDRPIYVLGESLGSGAGSALAGAEPERVAGLFLITPYASLPSLAAHHLPWLPVRWFMIDRFDNVAALEKYRGRLAVLIAGADEVVTAAQGRKLYDSYEGPKHLWVDEDALHNGLDHSPNTPWRREVSDFLLHGRTPR